MPHQNSEGHSSADSDNDDRGFISDIVYPELFSTDKLQYLGGNFIIWKLKLTFILTDRKLHHLLNPPPPPYPKPPPQPNPWDFPSCTPSVSLILRTLDNLLLREFKNYTTPEPILGKIFSRFDSYLKSNNLGKIQTYMDCRMAPDAHINQHIFRMRSLAKQIEFAGNKIPDDFQALVLLNSLPHYWEEDVERLLMEKYLCKEEHKLSWSAVCTKVRILWDLRKLRDFRTGQPKSKSHCHCCGLKGHQKSDCPSNQVPSNHEDSDSDSDFDSDSDLSYLKFSYSRLKGSSKLKYNSSYHDVLSYELCEVLQQCKVYYVLETPKPSKETSEAVSHNRKKWLEDDFTCRHLILGTLDDAIFLSFHDYPTAIALLDALKICFKYPSPARKMYCLQKYLGNRLIEGTATMPESSRSTPTGDHVFKMDGLVSKLHSSGTEVPEEIQSVILVGSLPDAWKDDRLKLYMKVMKTNFDEVRREVCNMGHLREILAAKDAAEQFNDSSNYNKRRKVNRGNCYSCGKPGHYRRDCPEQ